MYKTNTRLEDIIIILSSESDEIIYSNINHETAYGYIEKLNIFNYIYMDLPHEYNLEEYCVKIDKIIIPDKISYIITIRLNECECTNCARSKIDIITGLYSRNYLEEMKYNDDNKKLEDMGVIFIDIDELKTINDTYGHLEGDKAIALVGNAIRNSIRKTDIGIRYGGDEFIVILPNQGEDIIEKVIRRIKAQVEELNIKQNTDVSISMGKSYTNTFRDINKVIELADIDLYKNKEKKKVV